MVSKEAQRTELRWAFKDRLEAFDGFSVPVHKDLQRVMRPARDMPVAISGPLTQNVTSTGDGSQTPQGLEENDLSI